MGDKRKLQAEIERTLKRVQEGVDQFDEIFGKVQTAANGNQKEKYEAELKKEIKKLQRMRDQIKAWVTSNDVKDKKPLQEARKQIEAQMEKFKVIERETKAKPFSKEGLGMAAKVDPFQREQEELNDWLTETISRLNMQVDQFDSEIDSLYLGSKKKKLDRDKQETVDELTVRKEKHKFHIQALETILRRLFNHSICLDKIHSIQQNVDYYVECCRDGDFIDTEDIYEELQLSMDDAQALQHGNVFADDEGLSFQPIPIPGVPPMSPAGKTTSKEELQWKFDISPSTESHPSPRKLSTSRGSTSSTSVPPAPPAKITGKSILTPAKNNPPLTKSQSNPGPPPSPSPSLVAPPSRLSTTSSKSGPSPPIGYASVAGSGLQSISTNIPALQIQPQSTILQTQAHSQSHHSSSVASTHPTPSHPIPIPHSAPPTTSDVTLKDLGHASGASSLPKTQPMSLAQQAARAAQLPSSVPISSTKVPQRTPPSSLSIPLHQASVPQQATLKSSLPFQQEPKQVPLGSTPSHETPTSLTQYSKQISMQSNLTPLEPTCYTHSNTWNHSGFSTPLQPSQAPFPLPASDAFNSRLQSSIDIGREESTSDGLFFTPLTEPPSRFELLSKDSSMNAAFSAPGSFPGSVLPHIPSTAQPAGQHTYTERSNPSQQLVPGSEDMSNPDVNDPDSPSSLKQMASKVLKNAGLSHPGASSSQVQGKLESIQEARENLPSYPEDAEEKPGNIPSQPSESAKTGHNTPDIPESVVRIENKSSEDLRNTANSPNGESDETILTPLLGVSPLGSVAITPEMSTQTYMLEACSRHIPQLADSERVRQYTQRSPAPSAPYHHSQPPTFFCSHDFFNRLSTETLFFIFYYQEGTKAQYLAAKALKKQSWRFHTKYMMWFQRHDDPKKITDEFELGTYIYFDYEKWIQKKKEGFMFEYKFLEDKELN